MRLAEVMKQRPREKKTYAASLRMTPSQRKFIDKNKLSVQAIFDSAMMEIGWKEKK